MQSSRSGISYPEIPEYCRRRKILDFGLDAHGVIDAKPVVPPAVHICGGFQLDFPGIQQKMYKNFLDD